MVQCTATSKRTGARCGPQAVTGRATCRHHGGRSPRGLAHPRTKSGRYSKDLPTRLAERYREAAADPDLLALRDEIRLIDARLADVLSTVDTGESGRAWRELKRAHAALVVAQRRGDGGREAAHLGAIGAIVNAGDADRAAWADDLSLVEARRRLSESEQKRLVAMSQTITAEQAMALVGALVDAVRRHVTDRAVLTALSNDLERVLAAKQAGGGR